MKTTAESMKDPYIYLLACGGLVVVGTEVVVNVVSVPEVVNDDVVPCVTVFWDVVVLDWVICDSGVESRDVVAVVSVAVVDCGVVVL